MGRLAKWHEKVNQSDLSLLVQSPRTIINHYQTILNDFDKRNNNPSAESFNAKIKAFRSKFRGVMNVEFSF
ncbi:transposase [Flavobacterium sp.]|uniref:transposase n=1 Tax=Flavobacterium sp. TaxID=239 RepID=UPI00374D0920